MTRGRSEPSHGRPPAWLRTGIPIVLILVWLAGAAIGGPYFGKVGEVSSNDQAAFLPASADATLVGERFTDFVGDDTIPAIVILSADDVIDEETLAELETVVEGLGDLAVVDSVSPLIPSEEAMAAQAFIPLDAEADLEEAVAAVRTALAEQVPEGITHHVTGPAGFSADLVEAFAGIDGLLLGVALGAVLVILLVVYRSLLLPFLVLATSVFALCVALLVNWWLAKWGVVSLNGQTQGILFILVIGAATDYALLYTARYQEELRRNKTRVAATRKTIRGSIEPILASGGTVIAGLLCLLFSDLASNKSLGPVASIGIVFAMLSALTLLPAMLLLLGRAAFWPRRPVFDPDRDTETAFNRGAYAAIGRFISSRPRTVWVGCVLLLAVGAAFVPTLKADGVATSELVIGASDARDGQAELSEHFPAGSGDPANVLVAESDLQRAADILLAAEGVDSVAVLATDSPSGSAPVTEEGIQPLGPPGTPPPEPTVDDGEVLLQATLSAPGDSIEAQDTVRELRTELDGLALVGGTAAVAVDTNDTSIRDRNLIIPIVLAVILVILMGLLRSVLAPILLVATTVLSFGTAMGVAALVFNHVLDLPGADPSVPLYGFVFLVALGIDYNIFLMTRVREESLANGTRPGILRGLAVTGGVITSAGIVLAATFAALAVIPILFLLQLAFIVAFGVLLDTFLVRTLLVPALGLDIGRRIWWPNNLKPDFVQPRRARE
ncbi:MMPL family transporter [Tessaracoccus rhinocerotis]|uniref:MMPL family transporter n=1 Tax=Tessaracoccus rhinocerotis TaxID=1689449 RepID=A0A553K0Z0_9ACTN|nr:MMPL family transporter [Tessaracoccus rhinocerotis]TRY18376.1 MMPL family transporter [Tessaracoccus rhinocerotis]